MTKYDCCGIKYENAEILTDHIRSVHNVGRFVVSLSCCGIPFVASSQLGQHMKKEHNITVDIET